MTPIKVTTVVETGIAMLSGGTEVVHGISYNFVHFNRLEIALPTLVVAVMIICVSVDDPSMSIPSSIVVLHDVFSNIGGG